MINNDDARRNSRETEAERLQRTPHKKQQHLYKRSLLQLFKQTKGRLTFEDRADRAH